MELQSKIKIEGVRLLIEIPEEKGGKPKVQVRGTVVDEETFEKPLIVGLAHDIELDETDLKNLRKLKDAVLSNNQAEILGVVNRDLATMRTHKLTQQELGAKKGGAQ